MVGHSQWSTKKMNHVSDFMITKSSTSTFMIIRRVMGQLITHSPIYCIQDSGENKYTLNRIYQTSIFYGQCFQACDSVFSICNGPLFYLLYIDGSMQERCNSIANTLELRLSCIDPSICVMWIYMHVFMWLLCLYLYHSCYCLEINFFWSSHLYLVVFIVLQTLMIIWFIFNLTEWLYFITELLTTKN